MIVFKLSSGALLALVLLLVAKSSGPPAHPAPDAFPPAGVPIDEAIRWRDGLRATFAFTQKTEYDHAAEALKECLRFAERYPRNRFAATTFLYAGNNSWARFHHQDAIRHFLEARKAAIHARASDIQSSASVNLSSLYLQNYAIDQAIQTGMDDAIDLPSPRFRALQRINRGKLLQEQRDDSAAQAAFLVAVDEAQAVGDAAVESLAWNAIGALHLERSRVSQAEDSLVNAFRVERVAGIQHSAATLRSLAELRLAQGDTGSAMRLFEQAHAANKREGRPQFGWRYFHGKGRALLKSGRLPEALNVLRDAVKDLQAWRLDLLPADAFRIAGAAGFSGVYDAFVHAAAESYLASGDPQPLWEALAVSEARRALGLRAGPEFAVQFRNRVAPEYLTTLQQLQAAYIPEQSATEAVRRINRLKLRLTEMEAESLPVRQGDVPSPEDIHPERIRRMPIPGDSAIILFHCGRYGSYRFAGTRNGWRLARLPSKNALEQMVSELRQCIDRSDCGVEPTARGLYRELFANLESDVRSKRHWLLALDGGLFRLPLAALVNQESRYLVEDHSLQILPGIWALSADAPAPWRGPLLAVADPIYNTADERFQASWFERFAGFPSSVPESFRGARLPATSLEINAAERALGMAAIRLVGPAATLEAITGALTRQPSVVHFATHVVQGPQTKAETQGESLLALSLGQGGRAQILGPEWIGARDVRARLVVMSGCYSARGRVLENEGLMGLSRAWLYAGTQSVIATMWPTLDEPGSLLADFYRLWGSGRWPLPEALQEAQRTAIRAGGWRADPRFWATYFLVGYPAGK